MAGPNRRNRGTSEKPKDIKKALSRIVKELRKYYFLIILAIVLSTIASIITFCLSCASLISFNTI